MKSFIRPARTFALSATTFIFSAVATVFVMSLLAACVGRPVSSAPGAIPGKGTAAKTMRAFGSEEELKNYFRQLVEQRKRELARARKEASGNPPPAPSANQAATSVAKAGEGLAAKDESITNTQHAGVDEGGIVKLHGDHLVVLRRGRLFTVAVGDGALKPLSAVDAFGPDINPRYTWYDEMLVSDDTVAVLGYSYERGAAEVQRFVAATHVYRPERQLNPADGFALHTVTVCDLAQNDFKCDATAVLGPAGRVFYVAPDSVYVWTTDWSRYGQQSKESSTLYRMPPAGSRPKASGVPGS